MKKKKDDRKTWTNWDSEGIIHIIPDNDLSIHVFRSICECQPRIEEDGFLVIHNSFDKREYFEKGTQRVLPVQG